MQQTYRQVHAAVGQKIAQN